MTHARRGLVLLAIMGGLVTGARATPPRLAAPPPRSGPTALLADDVDGDGLTDLVTADALAGRLSLLQARPGGGFREPTPLPVGAGPSAVQGIDVDGDDDDDDLVATDAKG